MRLSSRAENVDWSVGGAGPAGVAPSGCRTRSAKHSDSRHLRLTLAFVCAVVILLLPILTAAQSKPIVADAYEISTSTINKKITHGITTEQIPNQ